MQLTHNEKIRGSSPLGTTILNLLKTRIMKNRIIKVLKDLSEIPLILSVLVIVILFGRNFILWLSPNECYKPMAEVPILLFALMVFILFFLASVIVICFGILLTYIIGKLKIKVSIFYYKSPIYYLLNYLTKKLNTIRKYVSFEAEFILVRVVVGLIIIGIFSFIIVLITKTYYCLL
jgi:hypothetical protein